MSQPNTTPPASPTAEHHQLSASSHEREVSVPHSTDLGAERERLLASERAARQSAESAQREAEAANRAKSEFLAVMSHEIRTPINAIRGYAQLLEIGVGGAVTPQQSDYLARLTMSADHLSHLISDVLDVAQIDAGRIDVTTVAAMTAPSIAAAVNLTRPLATSRGVHVIDEHEGLQGEQYVGDEHRVRQVLVNLLSNAIKFTPSGGLVTISCGLVEHDTPLPPPMVHIRVHDTGIGIAADQLSLIFEPFHQELAASRNVYTRQHGGTGLGLSISRRLARLMGGELTVESTPGVGSTFTLWLPAPSSGSVPNDQGEKTQSRHDNETGSGNDWEWPDPATLRSTVPLAERGLGHLGHAIRESFDEILASYVRRVRADPAIPPAQHLSRVQIEDHHCSFVSDLAQSLVIVAEAGADAALLLRDGSAIQRTIAEHHGARRRTQGWSEDAVRRDHTILREEIELIVRRTLTTEDLSAVEPTIDVLRAIMRRAESISISAWRRAGAEEE